MGHETWKPCPRSETHYEISSLGGIRRTAECNRSFNGKVLKPATNRKGYSYVCLSVDGKQKTGWVHRLVCEAFNGPPPSPLHQAAHRDDDKGNNAASNLYWATQTENMDDRARAGNAPRGARCGMAKVSEDDVLKMRELRASGWKQRQIGEQFGIAPHTVSRILSGKRWGHLAP